VSCQKGTRNITRGVYGFCFISARRRTFDKTLVHRLPFANVLTGPLGPEHERPAHDVDVNDVIVGRFFYFYDNRASLRNAIKFSDARNVSSSANCRYAIDSKKITPVRTT